MAFPSAPARYAIRGETETVLAQQQAMLGDLDNRTWLRTTSLKPDLEHRYLVYAERIERLTALLAAVDAPADVMVRSPGVSAVPLQSPLTYFRRRTNLAKNSNPVHLIATNGPGNSSRPARAEAESMAYERLIAIFRRISFAFGPRDRAFVNRAL